MNRKLTLAFILGFILLSVLVSVFKVQKVKADGTIYIRVDGSVDPPTAPIHRDGDVYTFTDSINDWIVVEKSNTIIDGNGHTLNGSEGTGFNLTSLSNVTIKNTNVKGFKYGIYLTSVSHNVIFRNNITNNTNGIRLSPSSDNNTLSQNNIINSLFGVIVSASSNNTISRNNITSFGSGIHLSGYSTRNNIYKNNIKNKGGGVWLLNSSNNRISENNITDSKMGINLLKYSNNNIISGNNIINNNYFGVWFCDSSNNTVYGNDITEGVGFERLHESYDNKFFHNNFIDYSGFWTPCANFWDNGFEGNYWSGYSGADSDCDGIGDVPYVLCVNNTDNYPLMHPYGCIRNLDTKLTYLTIQSAINANETLDGNTIFVEEEIYYETVVVNKSLSLIGENRSNTIIDGNFTGTVMNVTADNVNITGFTIRKSEYLFPNCGIYVGDCSTGNNISYNIITNNWHGILLDDSSNNTISGNNIINNYEGISILCSGSNVLKNNNITGNCYSFSVWGIALSDFIHDIDTSNTVNGKPIYYWVNQRDKEIPADAGYVAVVNSTNILVKNLTITKNTRGILFAFTKQSMIENVNISNNMYGIVFWFSDYNTICENTISSNSFQGVSIPYSRSNAVSDNTISNNDYGVYLDGSPNNRFYHNNFINNTKHVHVRISIPNYWDNGFEGNYWSDYNGTDSDLDGIGDTPYVIDVNNQDNYPLMGLFSDFSVDYEEETYHVTVIGNSSISDFQFNGTAIIFNVSGENKTTGFCRICIPKALMNDTYKVYVNDTEVEYDILSCSNITHSYLYFTYQHSIHEVTIIPEFPSWASMLLLMVVTVVVVIYKRRLKN